MNDKYTIINQAGEFRIFLHRLLANNEYIEIFKSYINSEFETLSTEYTSWQTFQFKIKKSNMKKKQNFTHTVDFYYSYIDNAIYYFLTDTAVQIAINEALVDEPNAETIKNVFDEIRSRNISCRCLYTATTTQDNIVVLII